MKAKRFANDELLASIDVLNTLNGGVSEHQLTLEQFSDHHEIRVRAPGVREENLKTEIDDNMLSVFYTFHVQSNNMWVEVPKIVYKKQIPHFVDIDKISASYENDVLTVTLPFNSMAQGYHRNISIDR